MRRFDRPKIFVMRIPSRTIMYKNSVPWTPLARLLRNVPFFCQAIYYSRWLIFPCSIAGELQHLSLCLPGHDSGGPTGAAGREKICQAWVGTSQERRDRSGGRRDWRRRRGGNWRRRVSSARMRKQTKKSPVSFTYTHFSRWMFLCSVYRTFQTFSSAVLRMHEGYLQEENQRPKEFQADAQQMSHSKANIPRLNHGHSWLQSQKSSRWERKTPAFPLCLGFLSPKSPRYFLTKVEWCRERRRLRSCRCWYRRVSCMR